MIPLRAFAALLFILLAAPASAQNPPAGAAVDEELVRAATDMFTMNDR